MVYKKLYITTVAQSPLMLLQLLLRFREAPMLIARSIRTTC
jgi:hypothetical protein